MNKTLWQFSGQSFAFPLLLCALLGLSACNSNPSQQTVAQEPQSQVRASGGARASAKVHTELGALYFEDGQLATALEELRAAIAADSGYAPAYNVLGLVHLQLNENEAAEQNFRRALSIAGNDPEINNNYGWFLCQTGRTKESLVYFNNAIKNPLYPTPERAALNAGRCAEKAGDLAGAEGYYLRSMRLIRDNAAAVLALSGLKYRQDDLGDAYALVKDFHKLAEPTAESLWLGLRLARKLGDRAEELSYNTQLRRRFPGSREVQALLKGNFE